MWFLIQKTNAVWHIDATGDIMQPMYGQKSSLLYSIVVYDPENRKNIPLFEYVTTEQTVKQISVFLFYVKEYCLQYKKLGGKKVRFSFAPIITTDFSYILLNSILKTFNNCDMGEYLQATFTILVKGSVGISMSLNVMIYLCSTHFLHSFIKKVRKNDLKRDKNQEKTSALKTVEKEFKRRVNEQCKTTVIFCFTLLQNARTLEEFNLYLENIFNFFNQQKKNESYINSKDYIERTIKHRNLEFDINFATSQKERERSKMFSNFKNDETKRQKKASSDSYKANSPWTHYYAEMIANFKSFDESKKPVNNLEKNMFFRPDLFKLITDQLYLTPVWSGMFIALHLKENNGNIV